MGCVTLGTHIGLLGWMVRLTANVYTLFNQRNSSTTICRWKFSHKSIVADFIRMNSHFIYKADNARYWSKSVFFKGRGFILSANFSRFFGNYLPPPGFEPETSCFTGDVTTVLPSPQLYLPFYPSCSVFLCNLLQDWQFHLCTGWWKLFNVLLTFLDLHVLLFYYTGWSEKKPVLLSYYVLCHYSLISL